MRSLLVLLLGVVREARGHGYMLEPKSRQYLARLDGLENCPHCVLAAPMNAVGGDLDSRTD
jgi:predicted carbohydrate-binding protein with CBM5 and CBM33 domain